MLEAKGRDRTKNLRIASPALCHLRYEPSDGGGHASANVSDVAAAHHSRCRLLALALPRGPRMLGRARCSIVQLIVLLY